MKGRIEFDQLKIAMDVKNLKGVVMPLEMRWMKTQGDPLPISVFRSSYQAAVRTGILSCVDIGSE